MKKERQIAIRELIRTREIQTQEEMTQALREAGYQVTQATVSRDIREMRLIKEQRPGGGFIYAIPEMLWPGMDDRMIRLLRDCVVTAEAAGQMIVVKTLSGAAGTAAEALDTLEMPEIAGSIAGDNTIFLVARDHSAAADVVERIHRLIM